MKKINPAIYNPLIQALSTIYWYKKDLKTFLYSCFDEDHLILLSKLDFDDKKYNISSNLVNLLIRNEHSYQEEIIKLIKAILSIKSFNHFDHLDDGKKYKDIALKNVAILRKEFGDYSEENPDVLDKHTINNQKRLLDFKAKLDEYYSNYFHLTKLSNPQKRGYEFEMFLNDLFRLFDIDSKGSFKIKDEQIDGAFSLDGTEYLLEAKWQNEPVILSNIYEFQGKVKTKLDNTLGLYISVNGYSNFDKNTGKINNIILCDSMDLMSVLENRIDLVELIKRKKQEASRTGNILFRVIE